MKKPSKNNKAPKKSKQKDIDKQELHELLKTSEINRLKTLLQKSNNNEPMKAHEVKQLNELQAKFSAEESAGRRIVGSIKEIAQHLGRSSRQISYYIADGMPVNPDSTYNFDDVEEWFRRKKGQGIGQPHGEPGDVEDMIDLRKLILQWQIKQRELNYQVQRGQLIPRRDVEILLEERAIEFKTELLERGRRLSLRLTHKDSQACQIILDEDSLRILEKYSRPHNLEKINNGKITQTTNP